MVDCRNSKTGRGAKVWTPGVGTTSYFADSCKACICKMRLKPEIEIIELIHYDDVLMN